MTVLALLIAPLLGGSLGCSSSVSCDRPDQVLSTTAGRSLTCGEARAAIDYVGLLAGRPMSRGDRRIALRALKDRFEDDPEATEAWLGEVDGKRRSLARMSGLVGAEARAKAVHLAHEGQGPIRSSHEALFGAQKRTLQVWSSDEDEDLALSEADIEGWIRYASLCREAQQGGPLRVSVADRVTVYRMLRERFERGSREEKIALTSMGAFWPRVAEAWAAAPYDTQQEWIGNAPLPGPMTATSLGYAEAIFDGDILAHARVLGDVLGPFTVGPGEPIATGEVSAP